MRPASAGRDRFLAAFTGTLGKSATTLSRPPTRAVWKKRNMAQPDAVRPKS